MLTGLPPRDDTEFGVPERLALLDLLARYLWSGSGYDQNCAFFFSGGGHTAQQGREVSLLCHLQLERVKHLFNSPRTALDDRVDVLLQEVVAEFSEHFAGTTKRGFGNEARGSLDTEDARQPCLTCSKCSSCIASAASYWPLGSCADPPGEENSDGRLLRRVNRPRSPVLYFALACPVDRGVHVACEAGGSTQAGHDYNCDNRNSKEGEGLLTVIEAPRRSMNRVAGAGRHQAHSSCGGSMRASSTVKQPVRGKKKWS